jgi:hypothetical protein
MPYTYRYIGDLPVVFTGLVKDGHTWEPNSGDTINLDEKISHPLLIEVVKETTENHASDNPSVKPAKKSAEPTNEESPVSADNKEH